ncbi:MAG TPA: hypothetical protein VK123_11650 [Candidatus Limnocylindrales bacterium]|nr:hypothetical protein [Candidatus Limnocylindrales bacterium]
MLHRRLFSLVLAVALLAGQTFVFGGRAACAVPRGANPPACSRCAAPLPSASGSIGADRSCCAAAKAAADREPATIGTTRGTDHRASRADFVALGPMPVQTASAARLVQTPSTFESPPIFADTPQRRATVFLI